jgi:hypothetical protein
MKMPVNKGASHAIQICWLNRSFFYTFPCPVTNAGSYINRAKFSCNYLIPVVKRMQRLENESGIGKSLFAKAKLGKFYL